jgi:Tfp pilus assembly ATPase PilU
VFDLKVTNANLPDGRTGIDIGVQNGRIAAIEILVSNSRTREYIEKGEKEGRSITDAMNDGELDGMQSFDKVLERYIREGLVTRETAMAYASNATNLALSITDMDEIRDSSVQLVPEPEPAPPTMNEVQIDGFER